MIQTEDYELVVNESELDCIVEILENIQGGVLND